MVKHRTSEGNTWIKHEAKFSNILMLDDWLCKRWSLFRLQSRKMHQRDKNLAATASKSNKRKDISWKACLKNQQTACRIGFKRHCNTHQSWNLVICYFESSSKTKHCWQNSIDWFPRKTNSSKLKLCSWSKLLKINQGQILYNKLKHHYCTLPQSKLQTRLVWFESKLKSGFWERNRKLNL